MMTTGSNGSFDYLDCSGLLDSSAIRSERRSDDGWIKFDPNEGRSLQMPPVPSLSNTLKSLGKSKKSMKSTWHNIPGVQWDNPFDPAGVDLLLHESLDEEDNVTAPAPLIRADASAKFDRAMIRLHMDTDNSVLIIQSHARSIVEAVRNRNIGRLHRLIVEFGDIPAIMGLAELYLVLDGFDCVWYLSTSSAPPVGRFLLRQNSMSLLITSEDGKQPKAATQTEVTPGRNLTVRVEPGRALAEIVTEARNSTVVKFQLPDNTMYAGESA